MARAVLAGLALLAFSAFPATAARDHEAAALARALQAAEQGDWQGARAESASAGALGRDIVQWHRLRAGMGSFDEYADFLARRTDWPGLPLLREKGEAAIPEAAPPEQVVAYFASQPPRTGDGALRLAGALLKLGRREDAARVAVDAWRGLALEPEEEEALLARFPEALLNHHRARQDMLLWRGLTEQARRLNPLVGTAYARLAEARIALLSGRENGVDALIDAVPAALADDPGLAHARFVWRLGKGRKEAAIDLLLKRSVSARALGRPERWSSRRRALAREMMRRGKPELAYRIAARHFLRAGADFGDLEWLAGYIALRKLDRPALALEHFRRFRAGVSSPISLARAGYWEGRALEALERTEEAGRAYAFAGRFQTAFYGQLAALKIGLPMDPELAGRSGLPDVALLAGTESSVLAAALLLHRADRPLLFRRFVRHLAESLDAERRGALARLALELEQPHAALALGKYAALRGQVIMPAYFPLVARLPADLPAPPELVLSVIRRESAFYPQAVSRVGARGLMQLMPATAREVARRNGLPYREAALLAEPSYNLRLGALHLKELQEDFGGYMPFVAVAYNAGPRRVAQWTSAAGDPRGSVETAVDWIEAIPFRETRNYVMRVMESLDVYRARLAGRPLPLRLEQELAGR